MNHSGGHLDGLQVSGLINRVRGTTHGAQITGLINYTAEMQGLQIAGLANHASGQLAIGGTGKDSVQWQPEGKAPACRYPDYTTSIAATAAACS